MLEALLIVAAAAAGVTGAWSPCGFSMVETLAPQGYAGRMRTTLVACATFSAGALAGGAVTFGGLALLGDALGAGGAAALAVAAAVALAAAIGEARGARILPQVRRQVPESWRRRMPVPLAAGLYGVLLGLGFTTFILTFAVWALAGVSVALGDPALGLAIGLAFGAGRLLPVVVLAPAAATEAGAAVPRARWRSARGSCARCGPSTPSRWRPAPSRWWSDGAREAAWRSTGATRAWTAACWPGTWRGQPGVLARDGQTQQLPGAHPAVNGGGSPCCAATASSRSTSTSGAGVPRRDPRARRRRDRGVGRLGRLARRDGDADAILAAPLPAGDPRLVLRLEELGRPALEGDRLAFHAAGRRGGRIVLADLAPARGGSCARSAARSSSTRRCRAGSCCTCAPTPAPGAAPRRALAPLAAPRPARLVHHPDRLPRPRLRARPAPLAPQPRQAVAAAAPRPSATLWTTALAADAAYVTRLRQDAGRALVAEILRVDR